MSDSYLMAVATKMDLIVRRSAQLMISYTTDPEFREDLLTDPLGLGSTYAYAWQRAAQSLPALYTHQIDLFNRCWQLQRYAGERLLGMKPEPVTESRNGDRRFSAEDWHNVLYFDLLSQAYLLAAESIINCTEELTDGDGEMGQKLRFHAQQAVDALAPSNSAIANPQVVAETLNTGGLNLLHGLASLLYDLLRGKGQLAISMTDPRPFQLGQNIASTPGKVVYQNEMMQLLQFEPTTTEVCKRPLLIVPPWINKYYILDLRQENSFIRWAVDQGYTLFVISWVNPDETHADKGFDDYLQQGVVAAIDAVEQATGEPQVDAIGYCLGGTLLSCANGYFAALKQNRFASSSYFTTLIDFDEVGDLGVFIDEEQLASLEKRMLEKGYLDGANMAMTFSMLRANDLVWPFFTNNYLLGKDPVAFDLLFWNADNTRMPAAMHSFYLRNMYQANRLREPGGITLSGVPIDLRQVTTPSYFVSTIDDHIAPWVSTFSGAQLFGGPVKFVLGGSGHIAGIINPPSANKYSYWTGGAPRGSADEWLKQAKHQPGSWWNDWQRWMRKRNGVQVPARIPGDGALPIIEEAPGSYVAVRGNQQAPWHA